MDLYRIAKVDTGWSYKGYNMPPDVRYGTRRRAAAVVRAAKEENRSRKRISEKHDTPYCPIRVTVERAPAIEFTDVSEEFWDDGEAGNHEPRRSGPDSPPAGESRVPGEGGEDLPADASADYARPSIPEGYTAISLSPMLVSFDCVNFYEVPDGTSIEDFLAEFQESKAKAPS